jgi:serine/threonine protein kinase
MRQLRALQRQCDLFGDDLAEDAMTLSMPAASQERSTEHGLAELIEELSARMEAGEAVDLQACLDAHPEHAGELRRLYPALQLLADFSRSGEANLPPDAEAATPAIGTPLGDFRILREIGRGGMGVVYEAEQLSLGRRVALKVLPFASTLDPRQLQRFRNEAHAAAQLHHTHIVPVYATGCERGVHYYAMQYVEGQTLAALIAELRQWAGRDSGPDGGTPMPLSGPAARVLSGEETSIPAGAADSQRSDPCRPEDVPTQAAETTVRPAKPSSERALKSREFFRSVAELGIQTAEALEHAHQLGVVHRDIKPGNLLVESTAPLAAQGRGAGGQGLRLWVADFGLAHVQSQAGLTLTGDLIGTLRYMSPEQALAKPGLVDHRTDIYSLGVTLYELLTLEPAFGGRDRQELLRQIAFEEPTPPARHDRAVPRELETIVLKAMAKEPAERYPSAQDLADDLQRFLEDQPIRARRPTLIQRARKWVRRHPGVFATATVALAAAVVILAVSTGLILRQYNRAEAKGAETQAVLTFVENEIIAAARPEGQDRGHGHDLMLREAMVKALPAVEKNFADQPLTEARLRMTMGMSFLYLGEAQLAAEQFERARTIYTAHLGPRHADTLLSMDRLATSYDDLGRSLEACALNEEVVAVKKAALGAAHRNTLFSMHNLATSYYRLGRRADALKLYEETLSLRKATLGPDHPNTLHTMHNLAGVYGEDGRRADAFKLYEQTLALRKAILGPRHPDTLRTMHNLANFYASGGRKAEALKLREETLPLLKAVLGPTHSDTISCMCSLGMSYNAMGRHLDALKLREEIVPLRKARSGPNSPLTFWSMHNLATSYYAVGRYAEAIKLHEEILALRRANLSANHHDTLASMNALAGAYAGVGRHAEALELREETLPLAQAVLGPTDSDTISCMGDLAHSYYDLGRHADALKLREEILPLRKARSGANHYFTFRSMHNLAESYNAVGCYAEALKLHDEVLALRKANIPQHPDTLLSMWAVANCYALTNRQAEGLKLFQETLALSRATRGADDAWTIGLMRELASLHMKMQEHAAAEALLVEALALAAKRQAQPPLEAAGLQTVLGDCLLHQKEFDKAEQILRACVATREENADGWETFLSKSLLGAALAGQKKYAEAAPLLLIGQEGLSQRASRLAAPDRSVLGDARNRLVQLYDAWGMPEKADAWRQRPAAEPPAQKAPAAPPRAEAPERK